MARTLPLAVALALTALSTSARAGGAGDVDVGLYTGLVAPGPLHELYDPSVALQETLRVGPALGARASYRPIGLLAAELATHISFSSSPDRGAATLYAYRGQALVLPPIPLPADIEPFALVGLGNLGLWSKPEVLGGDLDYEWHLGLGAKVPLTDRLSLRGDVNYLFADRNFDIGSPGGHTEILVGVSYRVTAERDRDNDGIPDSVDACMTEPETINRHADDDGCPDMLADVTLTVRDTEGQLVPGVTVFSDGAEVGLTGSDGTFTVRDVFPETSLALRAEHFHMERPEQAIVELVEGANAAEVTMEWMPGRVRVVTQANGEPMAGAMASFSGPKKVRPSEVEAGDQMFYLAPGDWQVLVTADTYGTQLKQFSIGPAERKTVVIELEMKPAQVKVTLEEVVILQQILFDSGSADIQGASQELMEEVTGTILANPQLKLIRIEGHTDSQGSASLNRKLSQSRVDSVMAWMINRGVPTEKLVAQGYGEDQPIASNATAEGRAQNRRVVFTILEQDTEVPAEDAPAE